MNLGLPLILATLKKFNVNNNSERLKNYTRNFSISPLIAWKEDGHKFREIG